MCGKLQCKQMYIMVHPLYMNMYMYVDLRNVFFFLLTIQGLFTWLLRNVQGLDFLRSHKVCTYIHSTRNYFIQLERTFRKNSRNSVEATCKKSFKRKPASIFLFHFQGLLWPQFKIMCLFKVNEVTRKQLLFPNWDGTL